MSKPVYINATILAAINAIAAAGHGVELEAGEGGNSHSVTFITIGVRREGEAGYVGKLRVKFVRRYNQFEDFIGFNGAFGDLCHYEQKSIEPFLAAIDKMTFA
jgi:hypothetical protein